MENYDQIIEVQKSASVDDLKNIKIQDPYGFIYITTNLVNGKKYLGQKRFNSGWKNYLGSGIAFKQALKKYGMENFVRDIVCICYTEEELNFQEYNLSKFFNVVDSEDWYNLVFGGGTSQGWHPSEETRKKIGAASKERFKDKTNHPMYGKHFFVGKDNPMYGVSPKERMDEETYRKWYEKHIPYWENSPSKGKHIWKDKPNPNIGKKMSEEQKQNLSERAKDRFRDKTNHPMYGKHHSEESKVKMSAYRSSSSWPLCKPVYCIETDSLFWSAKYAKEQYGIDSSAIIKCCRGKANTCGNHPTTDSKLHWLYAKDYITKEGDIIQGAISLGYITQERLDEYLNSVR